MNGRDCPDCGADDRLHDEIAEALADAAPESRRQLAGEARRRALIEAMPERNEAMPKRREKLIVAALAAAVLLIVGVGLMLGPGDGDVEVPSDRPEDVDVARGPEAPEAWGDPKPYESGGEWAESSPPDKVLVDKFPDWMKKDPLPTISSAPIGVLAGQVRSSDGTRLEGAKVTIAFDSYRSGDVKLPEGEKRSRSKTTDSSGEFRFENVPVGFWRLDANDWKHAPRGMTGLQVTDRSGLEGVAVVLAGGGAGAEGEVGVIEGTVTDAEGNPVAGALITLSGTVGGSYHTTRTDEEGKYRAERLLPGSYSVRCREKKKEGESAADYFRIANQSKFTNVSPGKATTVDFTGSGTLTGVVLDAQGNPLPRVIVRIAPLDDKGNFRDGKYQPVQVHTDEEGRFTMANAGTGPQSVIVQSAMKGNSFSVRLADLELDGRGQEVTLQLEESGIEGRITLAETGKPPAAKVHIAIYVVKPWSHAGTATMDEEGRYRFRSVPPGEYRLFVSLRGFRRGESDIDLASGELRTGVDFSLEKLVPGTIVFRVKDREGKPVEGLMFSYNSKGNVWSTLHVDRGEPGVFTSRQLETGTWKINVWRKDLAVKRVEVKVVSGETTKVDVVMEPRPPK
ncbi:MAG: carboxypeptidase regulatory-like domain-containing protein [Planctomycetota bacterium]